MGDENNKSMLERIWWMYAAAASAVSDYMPDLYSWRSKRVLKGKKVAADAKIVVWVHPSGVDVGESNILPETCTLSLLSGKTKSDMETLADKELIETIPHCIAHIEMSPGKFDWLSNKSSMPHADNYFGFDGDDTVLLDAYSGEIIEREPMSRMSSGEFIRAMKESHDIKKVMVLVCGEKDKRSFDNIAINEFSFESVRGPSEIELFDLKCADIHKALEKSVNNLKGGAVSCVATKSYGFLTPHVRTFNSMSTA